MTAELTRHQELPRTDDLSSLPYRLGGVIRHVVGPYLRWRYDLTIHHEELFPRRGPVLLAPNHVGLLDGPLLGATAPRMLHQLGKIEAFDGMQGKFLHRAGQIPVDRTTYDTLAIRKAIKVLRDGNVMSIYPEGTRGRGDFRRIRVGVAYLAMVTGAPILPVALLGTRLPGGSVEAYPPRGSRVDVVYGEPFTVERVPFPRRHTDVRAVADQIGDVLRAHVQAAVAATGHPLPGKPDQKDPDE
ncbi:lysophospholipid acyltransferase family protein [Kribbella sp. DT2]|uniref:lysophospholipid acyltransferase family protein n=1 Tax=Kribbella sp. DT2 TaxID=3393427 RepID=UPI003CF455EF